MPFISALFLAAFMNNSGVRKLRQAGQQSVHIYYLVLYIKYLLTSVLLFSMIQLWPHTWVPPYKMIQKSSAVFLPLPLVALGGDGWGSTTTVGVFNNESTYLSLPYIQCFYLSGHLKRTIVSILIHFHWCFRNIVRYSFPLIDWHPRHYQAGSLLLGSDLIRMLHPPPIWCSCPKSCFQNHSLPCR